MNKEIRLSEKYGVNPCLTCCPCCGKDTNEILLLGKQYLYQCRCGYKVIGGKPKPCPSCGSEFPNWKRLEEFEAGYGTRLPASEPCDECKKRLEESQKEIEKGGVPWRCNKCRSEGVIKADTEFAREFRKDHPIEGIQLEDCPVCNGEDVTKGGR